MEGYIPFAVHWCDYSNSYLRPCDTKIVAVGAYACACLELIFESQLRFVDLIAVDHDPQRLAALSVPKKICLDGTESQAWEQIKTLLRFPDICIIVTALEDKMEVHLPSPLSLSPMLMRRLI